MEVIGIYTITRICPRHSASRNCSYCNCPPATYKVSNAFGYKEYVCADHLKQIREHIKNVSTLPHPTAA